MAHRPVHWHEGLFLRPHHFQAAARHADEAAARSARLDQHHNWGWRRCAVDPDALGAFRLVVRAAEGRFRGGSVVALPDDAPAVDFDLRAAFAGRPTVDVFLAVPHWRPGQANAGAAGRYTVTPAPVEDENTGANPHPVPFRSPNVRVLVTGDDQAGFDVLPLARLEKADRPEATPTLAPGFIPPVLACDAWPGLQADILQQVYFRLNKKIEVLAGQVTSRGISFDSSTPGDARRMNQLARLNEGYAVLTGVAFAPGVHPFAAYLELLRLAGQLSVFARDARPPELPRYDHDDLGTVFARLKHLVDGLLTDVEDVKYHERPFVGAGLRMQVALEPAWLESGWQVYLGVRSNVPSEECVRMLTRPERLGMKIGSSDRVDTIFTRGQEGLRFTPAPRPPRDLPAAPALTYFEVSRDSATNEWGHVQANKTLAIRVQERDVVGSIDGQRELAIRAAAAGQTATFTFTLYLIPPAR